MRKEVSKAVEVFHKIAFKNSEAKKYISETQFAAFITFLTELLLLRYEQFWYPDEPERASGYRCIRVNGQSFDPVVSKSLKQAGIPLHKHRQLIFHDVTVWVDPGVVSMRIGEDGSIGHEVVDEELYAKNMAKRTGSPKPKLKDAVDSEIDEGIGSRSPSPPDSPTSDMSTPSRRARISPPPPQQEYNPYTMSSRVCNANRGLSMRQAMTPSHHQHQQQRTMTPPATSIYSVPHNAATQQQRPMTRPIMPHQGPPNMHAPPPSSSAGGVYHHGHIPASAPSSGSSIFPSARRSVFSDCGGMSQEGLYGKMVPSHFPMGYHSNPPNNYMDIPVVA